ncbi:MAG TPA: helix-hairpin-helix domain-containing protein [Thioploca sp.]|nr:helix-hairpin-helix domain-containing protein [Thioploca sp.]
MLLILLNQAQAIDINTATAEELAFELTGIGTIKSQRIIKHRELIGGFIAKEQLLEIKGIGQKTLQKNYDKIQILNIHNFIPTELKLINNPIETQFWKNTWIILIALSLVCLATIFISVRSTVNNKKIAREHLITTTFTCANCGKVSALKNIYYEGYIQDQYIDGNLPPGWSCIPNWLGDLCDYCFDCSQQLQRNFK